MTLHKMKQLSPIYFEQLWEIPATQLLSVTLYLAVSIMNIQNDNIYLRSIVLVNDMELGGRGGVSGDFRKIFVQFTILLFLNAVMSGPDAKISESHFTT